MTVPPPSAARETCSARWAKSADNIEGASSIKLYQPAVPGETLRGNSNTQAGLEFPSFHLLDRIIAGPRGQRHISKRGVHAGGGRHARPVGDEYILYVVRLVVFVEDGGFGIAPHAGRSHLMDGQAGRVVFDERLDVLGPGGGKHLCCRD